MASAQSQALIEQMRNMPRGGNATPAEMRAGMESTARRVDDDVTVEDTTAGGVPGKFFSAANSDASKVVLYFHGGGYVMGSPTTHQWLTGALAKASGARVLSLDYRLAPENPYPAAVQDATFAYMSLLESGYAPGNIALGGDSAGGGLALATILSLKDRELALPAAVVTLSPWTDLVGRGDSMTSRAHRDPLISDPAMIKGMADNYVGNAPATAPMVSPLYADFKGFPPLLIHVGSEEVLFDDSSRVAEKARAAGVETVFEEWDGQVHVFQMQGWMVPEGQESIDKIGAFIKSKLNG